MLEREEDRSKTGTSKQKKNIKKKKKKKKKQLCGFHKKEVLDKKPRRLGACPEGEKNKNTNAKKFD